MSPEQWAKMQAAEKKKKAAKNFGAFGPQTFKSRSLRAFQEDLEKGKASHLLPMFNAKEKLKQGKIKQEDIPYMQRGKDWKRYVHYRHMLPFIHFAHTAYVMM